MKRIVFLAAISLAFTVGFSFISAQAHNRLSFVSAQSGLDTNPCTRTEPCRSFAYALTQTDADYSPWTVVEAHDRRFATLKIFNTVINSLERAVTSIDSRGLHGS